RKTRRLFTDGSRGYTAFTVHTTAPADADLQAGEMVPYLDGSGHLWCKIKDSGGTVYTRQLS
ncbi:hypothetical protein OFL77_27225, partial [Escherichia coli]|uniref:hypothetical protein n=1 Tax=Escherichia coli TaxID=562 RepID=UPI0021E07976